MISSFAGLVLTVIGISAEIFALLSDDLKKKKRLKYIIVGCLFFLTFYAMISSLSPFYNLYFSNEDQSQSNIPIAIDATKLWQSSGKSVKKGEMASFMVVGGSWTTGRKELSTSDKEYLPIDLSSLQIFANIQYEQNGVGMKDSCNNNNVRNCPIPNAPWGALVAKIDDGIPFLIGNDANLIMPSDGTIYFEINDDPGTLSENYGIIAVQIRIN